MAEEEKKKETANTPKKDTAENKEEGEEVEVPKKFEELVKSIENLSVLELAELVKILEKKFGVSAAAPVAVAPAARGATEEAAEESEEKNEYTVTLKGAGDNKIEVIKAVRTITEKGLKEAKELVDASGEEPQVLKEGVPAEEAKEIEKTLKDAGALVELK